MSQQPIKSQVTIKDVFWGGKGHFPSEFVGKNEKLYYVSVLRYTTDAKNVNIEEVIEDFDCLK